MARANAHRIAHGDVMITAHAKALFPTNANLLNVQTVHPVILQQANAHATQRNAQTAAPLTAHAFPRQMNAHPNVSAAQLAILQQANAPA